MTRQTNPTRPEDISMSNIANNASGSEFAALALNVNQVAMLLNISSRTIWRLVSLGDMPAPVSFGRAKRWPRKAIESYVAAKSGNAVLN